MPLLARSVRVVALILASCGTCLAQQPQWPRVIEAEQPQARRWPEDVVATARARCQALLAKLDAVVIPSSPMRDGECGAPAPVELVSIGRKPQVVFDPPPLVTCDMVEAVDRWLKTEVQPAARKILGAPVNRLDVMSAYSCRNAYGRKRGRMSEHGRVNALDVRAFTTEKNVTADVLADWGMTEREVRATIARAERANRPSQQVAAPPRRPAPADDHAAAAPTMTPDRAATLAAESEPPAASSTIRAAPPSLAEQPRLRGTIDYDLSAAAQAWRNLSGVRDTLPSLGFGPPSRLGGPKPDGAKSAPAGDPASQRQQFLRHVHGTACKIFSTVLGPEANDAHRNHFHLDMAERSSGPYCY